MASIKQVYKGAYMKADDVPPDGATVTIASISVDDKLGKVVLGLDGEELELVCNKTNAVQISTMLGDETDGWLGATIELRRDTVNYMGKMVPGIRIGKCTPFKHQGDPAQISAQQRGLKRGA